MKLSVYKAGMLAKAIFNASGGSVITNILDFHWLK